MSEQMPTPEQTEQANYEEDKESVLRHTENRIAEINKLAPDDMLIVSFAPRAYSGTDTHIRMSAENLLNWLNDFKQGLEDDRIDSHDIHIWEPAGPVENWTYLDDAAAEFDERSEAPEAESPENKDKPSLAA